MNEGCKNAQQKFVPTEKKNFEPAFQPGFKYGKLEQDGAGPCEQMCEQTCEQSCVPS